MESDQQQNNYCHPIFGNHETHVSDGYEGELNQRKNKCEKNPDHTGFTPVATFNLNDLPVDNRDPKLVHLIQAVSGLTVRVSVGMTSPNRPEFWPGSTHWFSFYNLRGTRTVRYGSGWIGFVMKYQDGFDTVGDAHWDKATECWCKKCQTSSSPSRVWWEMDVDTSSNVIYDDMEAKHTSITLFYDSKDSHNVTVDDIHSFYVAVDRDRSELKCVTCDVSLGTRLEKVLDMFIKATEALDDKYMETRDTHKLVFIVSHPHGCTKQVSIGQWTCKRQLGKKEYHNQFTYTASTCPGSSGAPVHCVGYGRWGWKYDQLIHSGSFSQRMNVSGTGDVW